MIPDILTRADFLHLFLPLFSTRPSKMTTAAPAQTEYYKGYDDPTADMMLEVKGGVKFRVHSY